MADVCLLDETPPLVIDMSTESPDIESSVTEGRQHGILCLKDSDENHKSAKLHKNASNIGQASKNLIDSQEHHCHDKLFQGSDGESLATHATSTLSNLHTSILDPSSTRELNNDISSDVACLDKFSFSDRNTLKAFERVNDLTKSSSVLLSIGLTCNSDNKDTVNNPLESVSQKSDQNKLDKTNYPDIVKNTYRCPICMKFTTDMKEALYSHKENCCTQYHFNDEIHLSFSNNTFTCHTCATSWTIRAEFEEHVVCHITNCPYVCLTCKQNFGSRQSIESHANTEHPLGDAKCGLRGIKKGRKCVEDLIKFGNIVFGGKAIIAKTPRSIIQITDQPEICRTPESLSVNSETQFSVDSDSNSLMDKKTKNIQEEDLSSASNSSQSIMKVSNNIPSNIEIHLHELPQVADSQMLCKKAENTSILAEYCASTCEKDDSSSSQNVQSFFSSSKGKATKDLPSCHQNSTSSVHTVPNVLTTPSCSACMLNSCGVETLGNAFILQCLNSSKPLFSRVDPGELDPANSEHLNSQQQQLFLVPFNPIMQVKQTGQDVTPGFTANSITNSAMQPSINSKSIQQHPVRFLQPNNHLPIQLSPTNMPLPQPFNLPVFHGQQNQFNMVKDNGSNNANPSNMHQKTFQTLQAANTSPQMTLHYVPQASGENSSISTVPLNNAIASLSSLKQQVFDQNPIEIAKSQVLPTSRSDDTIVWSNNSSNSCSQPYQNFPKPPPSYEEAVSVSKQSHNTISNGPSVDIQGVSTMKLEQDSMKFEHQKKIQKLLFRIKPGHGFVCEYCKKFTRNDVIFRRHVFDHFHESPIICKSCSADCVAKKDVINCSLVNNIVCNLMKKSSELSEETGAKTVPLKTRDVVVINITEMDYSNETKEANNAKDRIEIIVLDEDDDAVQNEEIDRSPTHSSVLTSSYFVNLDSLEKYSDKAAAKLITNEMLNGADGKSTHLEIKDPEIIKETDELHVISASVTKKDADEPKSHGVEMDNVVRNHDKEYDNHFGSYVIDKTFTEEVDNSKMLVSDVGSSLNDLDPTNQDQMEKCIDNSVQGSTSKDLNNRAVKESSDKSSIPFDSSANRQQLCDTEVMKTHGTEEFYMCGYERCSFSCSSSAKYREHLHCDWHQQECTFVCSYCGQKDYIEDSHVRHVLSHANCKVFILYKCPISTCKFKTNILRMYVGHLSDHKVEELKIKCTYCHKTFPTLENLCEHLKHNLLKFVCCPHCSFKCVNKSVVTNHIKMCHPDKPRLVTVSCQIVCHEREINFYVPPVCITKDRHKNASEVNGSQGNCIDIPPLLDEIENANSNKAAHSLNNQNIALESRNPNSVNESAAVEVEYINVQETKKAKNINSGLGPKSYKCPHCTYMSYNHIYHKQHVALHDKDSKCDQRFVCNLCPKGVDNIAIFKKHLMNHVGKNEMKIFSCTFCTYNTNQKCHIMDHLQDNHDGKGTYIQKVEIVVSNEVSCKHCDFSARSSEQVALHETMLHQEQPVVSVEALTVLPEAITNDLNRKKDKFEESADCKQRKKYHCDYCQEFFKHKVNLKDHLQNNHKNIECVQFIFYKCNYCSFSSTMKDVILSHSTKKHVGREVRVLRKFEAIKRNVLDNQVSTSISKETQAGALQDGNFQNHEAVKTYVGELLENDAQKKVQVPDGNTFKHSFMCPICDFSTNLRINLMRHFKTHPELKPVRQKKNSLAKKSTTEQNIKIPTNRQNSLVQDLSGAGRQLLNLLSPVKLIDKGKSEKCIATPALDNPSMDLYILGEPHLHSALSACFVQVDSSKFQCKICFQKIAKMFILHRHILDHLKIVLFKCKYCEEGTTERTLMVRHIKREHSSQPLDFIQVSTVDLERQFNETILPLKFSNIDTYGAIAENVSPREAMCLMQQPVHELTESNDEVINKYIKTLENNQDSDPKMPTVDLKCNMCRYIARNKRFHNMHLEAHDNPFKKFTCSECDYRGDTVAVIKHIYNVFHMKQPTVIEDREVTTEQEVDRKVDDCQTVKVISVNKETLELDKTGRTDLNEKHCRNLSVTDSPGKQVKLPNSGVLELRTLFKCKDCGKKRGSKSGMYKHFQSKKSWHPFFQCSLCSFRSTMKTAIDRHAVIRHNGKKVLVIPLSRKIKTIQFHVNQSSTVGSERKKIGYIKHASSNYSSKGLLKKLPQNLPLPETHTDPEQIKCQLCSNYSTDSVITLQDHLTTVHLGTFLYCLKCSYKTPIVKHMINHCKNVHIQKIPLYRLDNINCSTKLCKPEKDGANAGLNDSKNASLVNQNDSKNASSLGQNNSKNASLVGQNNSKNASLVGKNNSKNASLVGQNDSKNASLVGKNDNKNASLVDQNDSKNASLVDQNDSKNASLVDQNDSKNAISISKGKKRTTDLKCPKCDYSAASLNTIKLHIQQHFAYKPFHCNYCELQFNRIYYMKRHLQVHHPKTVQQKYSVKTDDAIEAKVQSLLDHVMKTNEQNFGDKHLEGVKKTAAEKQKMVLGQARPSQLDNYTLVQRAIRKDGNDWYCDICGLKMSSKSHVKQHIENIHHRKRSLEKNSDTESPAKKLAKFHCVETAISTLSENDVLEKSKSPLKYKVRIGSDGKRQFNCAECSYTTEKLNSLKSHRKSHQPRRYHCQYCNFKTFLGSIAFQHTMNIHVGQDVKILNEDTGKIMTPGKRDRRTSPDSSISLERSPVPSLSLKCADYSSSFEGSPIKPKVIRDKPLIYCCNLCPAEIEGKFHFQQHLAIHVEFKHLVTEFDSETKLSCGYCSYVARNDLDLSVHIQLHMSEAQYKCPYCEYTQCQYEKVQHHVQFIHSSRKEIVIDREKKNGILLVNLNPNLQLIRVKAHADKKKYKRIVVETDEESSGESTELEIDGLINMMYGSSSDKCTNTVLDKQKSVDGKDQKNQNLILLENKKVKNSFSFQYEMVERNSKIKEMPEELSNVTKISSSDYFPTINSPNVTDKVNVVDSQEKSSGTKDASQNVCSENNEDLNTECVKAHIKARDSLCMEMKESNLGCNSTTSRQVDSSCGNNVCSVNTHTKLLNSEYCEGHATNKNVGEQSRQTIAIAEDMDNFSDIPYLKINSTDAAEVMDTKVRNAEFHFSVKSGKQADHSYHFTNVLATEFESREDSNKTSKLLANGDNIFDILTSCKDANILPNDRDDSDATVEKFQGDTLNHQSEHKCIDDSEASNDSKNIFDPFSKENPVHDNAKGYNNFENYSSEVSVEKIHGNSSGTVLNEKSHNFFETPIDQDSERD